MFKGKRIRVIMKVRLVKKPSKPFTPACFGFDLRADDTTSWYTFDVCLKFNISKCTFTITAEYPNKIDVKPKEIVDDIEVHPPARVAPEFDAMYIFNQGEFIIEEFKVEILES